MIKLILTKLSSPVKAILYAIKRRKGMQKMMVYYLKIKQRKLCATYKIQGSV
jgi:hypothetical protein